MDQNDTKAERELHLHKVATTKVASSLSCTENDEMSLLDSASTDYSPLQKRLVFLIFH